MAAINLATLAQVKKALHIEHNERDDILALHIAGASGAVLRYLKSAADAFIVEDVLVEEDMPPEVLSATILLVKLLEDGYTKDDFPDPDALPFAVRSLLYPLRVPTLA